MMTRSVIRSTPSTPSTTGYRSAFPTALPKGQPSPLGPPCSGFRSLRIFSFTSAFTRSAVAPAFKETVSSSETGTSLGFPTLTRAVIRRRLSM